MKRLLFIGILISIAMFFSPRLFACGHDGAYICLGYYQLFMFTNERQLIANPSTTPPKVHFGPGFGAQAVVGYDFKKSRWGVQMPLEYARIRLNHDEWVHYFSQNLEGVLHLVTWASGWDIRLVGGLGWSYLSEGPIKDRSRSYGFNMGLGPGLAYYFHKGNTTAAAVLEVPVRGIYFFGDHLSKNHTFVISVPIRLSIEIGFP